MSETVKNILDATDVLIACIGKLSDEEKEALKTDEVVIALYRMNIHIAKEQSR